MKCHGCSFPIWHTIHGTELCKPCAIKAEFCSDAMPDNRKCPICNKVAPIETLFKKTEIDLGQAKQIMTYCTECKSVFFPEIKDYSGKHKFNESFDKSV